MKIAVEFNIKKNSFETKKTIEVNRGDLILVKSLSKNSVPIVGVFADLVTFNRKNSDKNRERLNYLCFAEPPQKLSLNNSVFGVTYANIIQSQNIPKNRYSPYATGPSEYFDKLKKSTHSEIYASFYPKSTKNICKIFVGQDKIIKSLEGTEYNNFKNLVSMMKSPYIKDKKILRWVEKE